MSLGGLRSPLRAIARRPAYAGAVVATLAVGFTASLTLFGLVESLLLRQLPLRDPERVVAVAELNDRFSRMGVARPNFEDFRQRAESFAALAFTYGVGREVVRLGDEGIFAATAAVSRGYLDVLGTAPAIGRWFTAEESQPAGAPAVVVSDRFWRERLGAAPRLDGLHLAVGDLEAPVIGVLPAGFAPPDAADLWYSAELERDSSTRTAHNLNVYGRLRAGVTPAAAQSELDGILGRLRAAGEDLDAVGTRVRPLRDELVEKVRPTLLLLQGATLLLLLLAVVNAASLLLARGVELAHETAVRRAMGAGSAALLRRWLSESALLAFAAALLGVAGARAALAALPRWSGLALPRSAEVGLHAGSVLVLVAVALAAALAAALAPLAHALRTPPAAALTGARGATSSVSAARLLKRLAAAQVALVLTLLVGGGLLTRSLGRILSIDDGMQPERVLVADFVARSPMRAEPAASARFVEQLLERLAQRREIAAAGVTNNTLFAGWSAGGTLEIEGVAADANAHYRMVSAGTFPALGIPLLSGRGFAAGDVAGAPGVAVVSESFARRWFPDGSPLGARLRYRGMDSLDEPWLEVVGVAADVRDVALTAVPRPVVYVDFRQRPLRTQYALQLLVRAEASATAVDRLLRTEIAALDSTVPLDVRPLAARRSDSVADRRLTLFVLAALGTAGLTLAGFGLYSSLRYLFARRARELALRLALGALPSRLGALVARDAMTTTGAGLATGALGAAAVAAALRAQLFGVAAWDGVAWSAAVGVLVAVSLLAAVGPWRRALHLDPATLLREE